MAHVILAETATESDPFRKDLHREEMLVCHVYGGAAVHVEIRDIDPERNNWVLLRVNGETIAFESVGDSFILTMSLGYEYRLHTAAEGSLITKQPL